ncbi:MAG TPA: site-specific integrase [Solirubrobacterales bacterium]
MGEGKLMARVTGHIQILERKRGDKFYLRYRVHGQGEGGKDLHRSELIGPVWPRQVEGKRAKGGAARGRTPDGYFTKRMAEDWADERLADLRRGEAPLPNGSGKTWADCIAEWLRYCEEEKGLEASTMRDYCNEANGALKPEFGPDTPAESIEEDRIEAYRTKLLTDGKVSRRTAQKRLVMLGGIFKRAKKLKWIPSDPTVDVEPVSVKVSGDFNVLTVEQVEQVARACEDEMFRSAVTVAAFTGLRTGELRALRWRDIDFGHSAILVRSNMPAGGEEKAPKSDKVRSVPLMDDAARALDALSRREHFTAPADRVFPGATGGMLGEDAFRDALYEAMSEAGIDRKAFPGKKGFTFHDLRHTFGTLAVQVWPLSDVQAYMGHADIQTTMRYVHHMPKTTAAREFTEAVQKMREAASDGLPAVAAEEVAR